MVELQHDMANQVSLDVSGAVKSFKTLTSAVKANSVEWKANVAAAKRNGDEQKAQQIKIEGLSKAVELQKAKLADLKKQQSEVDTSTEKGTKRYYDLESQITKTNSEIEKQTNQLNKAKTGMNYYTSGLADLQKGYKSATQLSQSYIDRLEAEGKTQEANKVKMNQYKDSIDHFNKQLTIQKSELEKVAASSGKNSDAYRQQEIRVNKTAVSLANAKTKMTELAKTVQSEQPTGFFDKLKQKITGTQKEAGEAKRSIADIAKGSFIGTGLSNAVSGLGSSLVETAKNGFELAKAGREISENWAHIGVSDKGVKELTGQIGELRGISNASGAAVTKLQTSLYGLTNGNIKQTKALTNELYAFGKAGGAGEEQITKMGSKLTRVFSSNKVNLATFNRTFAEMPGLKTAIQQASGLTKTAFNDALANGRFTGKQMESFMIKASSKYGDAWSKFGDTTEGKIAKAKGTWTNFTAAVMKPLAGSAIEGMNKGLDKIVGKNGKLNETGKHLQDIISTLAKNVGKGLISTISFIGSHTSAIKIFGSVLLTAIAGAKLIQGIGATVNAFKTVSAAIKASTVAQKALSLVMNMNPWVAGLAAVAAGFTLAYKNIKPFRNWVNDLAKDFSNFFKSTGKNLSAFGQNVQKVFSNSINWIKKNWDKLLPILGGPIGAAVTLIIKNLKPIKKTISSVISWFKKIPKNIKSFFNKAVNTIQKAWHTINKDFSSFGQKFKKDWDSLWNGIHKYFKDIFDKVFKAWTSWAKSIHGGLSNFGSKFKSAWNSLWNGISKIFNDAWKGIKKLAENAMNGLINIVNGGISAVDSVIHAFGGKTHTIKLLSHIKLAAGTDSLFKNLTKPITKPVIATLNDGNDSPETGNKEMLIRGNMAGIIQGRNTIMPLLPGDHIINAKETAMFMALHGMPHFAKGTDNLFSSISSTIGNAVSGAWNWVKQTAGNLKKYFDLATKIISHPIKYVEGLFKWTDSKNIGGSMTNLTKGAFNKTLDSVKSWWSNLWNIAGGDLNGGSSKLLSAVEKYGSGHEYVWGAAGPTTFDCSGLVMYALKKAFGIDYPHFSGSQYDESQHISKANAHSGDLVFWGTGGSEHVGVYAGGNRYFSAQSPSQGIHMNTLDSVVGYGSPKFGRVKGIGQNTETKVKNSLQSFIKNEVGNGFFKFMQKLGSMFNGGDLAGKPSGSHQNWLAEAHIPKSWWSDMSWIIDHESSWEATAKNPSSTAYGIGQLENYSDYQRHGSNWRTNPIAQLMGMKDYITDRYGNAANAKAAWQTHAAAGSGWYANGGFANTPSIFGEAGLEVAIPLESSKHNRATQLLEQTTKIVKGTDNSIEQENTNNMLNTIIALLGTIADDSKIDKIITLIQLLTQNPIKVDTKVNLDGKTLAKQLEKYQVRRQQGGVSHYAF